MVINGINVSASALSIALAGRKIEAIKLVRDQSDAYVGLKDAKDAVEAAMDIATVHAPSVTEARVRLLETAIVDHVLGIKPLPRLGVNGLPF